MTPAEAIRDALSKHTDCSYGDWANGMDFMFRITVVVHLWRNEECWASGDPPKYTIEGYKT